jgi:hypothetical protein
MLKKGKGWSKVKTMDNVIEAPDFTKLLKKAHNDKWVAFSSGYKEVVDYSDRLDSLQKKVGDKKVIYYKVIPSDVIFAPATL